MSKKEDVVLEEEVIEESAEEVAEEPVEKELTELEKWLLDVTKAEDVNLGKTAVERALAVEKIIPQIGVLSVMIGPGGVLQTLISQNLSNDDGMDNVEAALLDIQRNIVQSRRQKKLAQEVPGPKE